MNRYLRLFFISSFFLIILLLTIQVNQVSADCTSTLSNAQKSPGSRDDGIDDPYVDNGDGTVTDQGTELMRQQVTDGNQYVWEDACTHC